MIAVGSALFPQSSRALLRVGVSGHRVPPKLPHESEAPIRALVDRILAAAVTAADAEASAKAAAGAFAVVSSIAEGADRIVAAAGLAAGFDLYVVLPLPRAEYARDFESPQSRAAFEALLAKATAVVEIGGTAEDRPQAYEAAGFAMLANSDLLIAIWDGEGAAGVGGTAEIVSRAIADGIPVVWIEPIHPHTMQLARPGGALAAATPQAAFATADMPAVAAAVRAAAQRRIHSNDEAHQR